MENDRLLEALKQYFNEYFDAQEKKLEAIEKKLIEVHKTVELIDKNQDYFSIATNEKLHENNTLLQSIHKGGMTFLLQLESLQKYIQDLAWANSWKLPEKRKKPAKVE